ncbi:uncharacterized protein [Garra rufa]|uniref:uncharacterized protein n=1 Tax=Garra rufa TaxID=137080 RepID=UPI003CCE788B
MAAGFAPGTNQHNIPELFHTGKHISIDDLKMRDDIRRNEEVQRYLSKTVPDYPTPVEFHVTEVSHVTNMGSVQKIFNSGGFIGHDPNSLSWWSLKINEADIQAAEERYLESEGLTTDHQPFLSQFTTSPAFDNETSRYGNFRFTFPLTELMEAYKQQMCDGQEPVLRVYGTKLFKKKIEYIILVHSPQASSLPELTSSPCVDYDGNRIVWRAQAICETHNFQLLKIGNQAVIQQLQRNNAEFYVWDQVSLVFYTSKVLSFPKRKLKDIYTYCKLPVDTKLNLSKDKNRSCDEADKFIKSLPDE